MTAAYVLGIAAAEFRRATQTQRQFVIDAFAVRDLHRPYVNVSRMMRRPLEPRVGNDDVTAGPAAPRCWIWNYAV